MATGTTEPNNIRDAWSNWSFRTSRTRYVPLPESTKISKYRTILTLKIFAEIDFSALRGGIARCGGRFVAHLRVAYDEVAKMGA